MAVESDVGSAEARLPDLNLIPSSPYHTRAYHAPAISPQCRAKQAHVGRAQERRDVQWAPHQLRQLHEHYAARGVPDERGGRSFLETEGVLHSRKHDKVPPCARHASGRCQGGAEPGEGGGQECTRRACERRGCQRSGYANTRRSGNGTRGASTRRQRAGQGSVTGQHQGVSLYHCFHYFQITLSRTARITDYDVTCIAECSKQCTHYRTLRPEPGGSLFQASLKSEGLNPRQLLNAQRKEHNTLDTEGTPHEPA